MNNPGQIVSASRFAELTGVSRERLRMWERRHGFPAPLRVGAGPRRYALADVPRVVAVRRAVEAGVPIPAAIARTVYDAAPAVSATAFRSAFEHAPMPAALLSGPAPLRVEYANASLRAIAEAPRAGHDLLAEAPAFAGTPCARTLRELFTAPVSSADVEHPAWNGRAGERTSSIAYRLPVEPDERPLIAIASIETERERVVRQSAAELERDVLRLRERDDRYSRWIDGAASVTSAFQLDPGPAVLDHGIDVLVRQLHALDGVVGRSVSGQIVVPPSRRRLMTPGMVTVAAHQTLARHLRDADPLWLEPATASAFGVPPGLFAAAAPILVGGETLGLLLLLYDEVEEIGTEERKLLTILGSALGFALLRDRLVDALRDLSSGA